MSTAAAPTAPAALRAALAVLNGEFADLLREDLAARPDLDPALAATAAALLRDARALALRAGPAPAGPAADLDARAARRLARDFDALAERFDHVLDRLHGGVAEPTALWCKNAAEP
jgi:hypothetical protein